MTAILAICVAVLVSTSLYLMLGRELKAVAMGVFLLGHAANLTWSRGDIYVCYTGKCDRLVAVWVDD